MKKKLLMYGLMTILLLNLVLALDECQPVTEPKEVPCRITSPWDYPLDCTNYTSQVYTENGSFLKNYTFEDWGDSGLCVFTWDVSDRGSYTFIVDLIDETGEIVIGERLDRMIAIILGLGLTVILFISFGFISRNDFFKLASYFFAFIEMVVMLGLLYVNESGGDVTGLLRINFYSVAIVLLCLLLFRLVILVIDVMDLSQGDSEGKWGGEGKW